MTRRSPSCAAHPVAAPLRISIDTLNVAQFAKITRRGELATVVAGLEAAVAAGLRVKLNTVALNGVNHEEVAAICEFAWERVLEPYRPLEGILLLLIAGHAQTLTVERAHRQGQLAGHPRSRHQPCPTSS